MKMIATVAAMILVLLAPTGMYFDYARVTPDRLEWMAVAEPFEYQWFWSAGGDSLEWLPATDVIPSVAPLGMPVPYSIKPGSWIDIRPGVWMVCGYGFFAIPWMVDCEIAEYMGG